MSDGQVRSAVETAARARRRDQLLDPNLERRRNAHEDRERRIPSARFERGPSRPGDPGQCGGALLREGTRRTQRSQVVGEVLRKCIHVARVARCCFIDNLDDRVSANLQTGT